MDKRAHPQATLRKQNLNGKPFASTAATDRNQASHLVEVLGWRGKKAVTLTIIGFVMLLLAYVGTKFVVEILLGRT